MCFTSVVHEQFAPYVPQTGWWPTGYPTTSPNIFPQAPAPLHPTLDAEQLREFIAAFRAAAAAAEVFDRLTGQPDCVDPEKAKLEARITELERRLDEADDARA